MVKLSERIFKKDILKNKYLVLCYDIMRIIQKEHDSVLCKEDAGKLKDIYERNYIITFAYLMGRKAGRSRLLSDKFVNGELKKEFILYPQNDDFKTKAKIYPMRNYYCPDFVIHTSHEKTNEDFKGQCLIMEAKTTSELKNKDFYWDLFKLNLYIEKLDYETAVYLIVNTTFSEVKSKVERYNKNNYWYSTKLCRLNTGRNNKKHHIFFLIQESVEKQPKIYELMVL
jgi:hypothetical protein